MPKRGDLPSCPSNPTLWAATYSVWAEEAELQSFRACGTWRTFALGPDSGCGLGTRVGLWRLWPLVTAEQTPAQTHGREACRVCGKDSLLPPSHRALYCGRQNGEAKGRIHAEPHCP